MMDSTDTSNGDGARKAIGVYTKTTVQSPVVRFIIPARIRHRRLNDVVFVGDGFIHVKHVGKRGHLSHVAFKNDFDAPIRHATSFWHEKAPEDDDFLVKLEKEKQDTSPLDAPRFPPQSIVLTLEFEIVFIFLRPTPRGDPEFVQQVMPMSKHDRKIYQPGHFLAADPHARALAVAAQEKELIIYGAVAQERVQEAISNREKDWCPVSDYKPVKVEGAVQQISFLIPPDNDPDHIILLVIVIDQGLMKAVRIDWSHSTGPRLAQKSAGQPLETATTVPSLLIPLQDAAFLLVTGSRMTMWKGILSGSTTGHNLAQVDDPSQYPGISGARPSWASWAKPQRSQAARATKDVVYLVREDGIVHYMIIPRATFNQVSQHFAGDLECHAGSAFASLGSEGDPDILCVAGDTSSGRVVSIGNFPTAQRIADFTRGATMEFKTVELLSNWASVADMVPSEWVHTNRNRIKEPDSLFVTSGRQPYGSITELRTGIQGLAAHRVDDESLRAVNNVWALPDLTMGALIFLLSDPLGTAVWRQDADFKEGPEPVDESAFDTEQRTVIAGIISGNTLVQVTPKSICTTQALHANFEDTNRKSVAEDEEILAASIPSSKSTVVVVAVQRANSHAIVSYSISTTDDSIIADGPRIEVPSRPLCVASITVESGTLVLTSTSDGRVFLIFFDGDGTTPRCVDATLPTFADQPALCDHISIMESDNIILAACGLRDGTLVSYVVEPDAAEPLKHFDTTVIASSTIRLASVTSDHTAAIAMAGDSTLLLRWSGKKGSLDIQNIWIADKSEPGYAQSSIVASCQMPDASYLSSDTVAGKFIFICDGELLVVALDHRTSTVPRQLPTSGSPSRLVYAESLRHLVCSGLRYDVRTLPSRPQAPPQEKRQLWPVIEFIAVKYTRPTETEPDPYTGYAHELQPGEKINALLPFSLKRSSGKTYAWVIVGGSYMRKNGTRRGKVTLLWPKFKRPKIWELDEVEVIREETFEQEVTALAVYDETTYVACAGNKVHLYSLDVDEKKWEQRCPAFTLASAGVFVTVEGAADNCRQIVISTARDSIVVLCLVDVQGEPRLQPVCTGPRADYLISHYYLQNADDTTSVEAPIVLAGAKDCKVIGMSTPTADKVISSAYRNRSALLQFEARLPYSLSRLRPSAPMSRKGKRPSGLASNRILGLAADGTVVALATIEEATWRKLFWLQRLIEWDDFLSPYAYGAAVYQWSGDAMTGDVRAVPIGLKGEDQIMLQVTVTHHSRLNDMHIDGDVLARVLREGGVEAVRARMKALTEQTPTTKKELQVTIAIGSWMARNIEAELEALDGVVEIVRKFDAWL